MRMLSRVVLATVLSMAFTAISAGYAASAHGAEPSVGRLAAVVVLIWPIGFLTLLAAEHSRSPRISKLAAYVERRTSETLEKLLGVRR